MAIEGGDQRRLSDDNALHHWALLLEGIGPVNNIGFFI